ncbi:hypothetical protein PM082_000588 [Marasmius tenuissimus]|nr:hypothetical protein PM082_000588 [Marasmius tenuissimus]
MVLGILSIQTLFLGILNISSITELLLPNEVFCGRTPPTRNDPSPESDVSHPQRPSSNTMTHVVCGAFGSIIIYYGEILQSGSGSATSLFLIITMLLTCGLSFVSERHSTRRPLTTTRGTHTQTNGRYVFGSSSLATFFAMPTRTTPTTMSLVLTVSPAGLYSLHAIVLLASTQVAIGLGLCSTFEAHGICREQFQADFWDVVFYHLALLAMAIAQDFLLGIPIVPVSLKLIPVVKRFQRPYAFILLPSLLRLHHGIIWKQMIPLLLEGIDRMCLMMASVFWRDPLAIFEQVAEFIVNIAPSSPSAGLWVAATTLVCLALLDEFRGG